MFQVSLFGNWSWKSIFPCNNSSKFNFALHWMFSVTPFSRTSFLLWFEISLSSFGFPAGRWWLKSYDCTVMQLRYSRPSDPWQRSWSIKSCSLKNDLISHFVQSFACTCLGDGGGKRTLWSHGMMYNARMWRILRARVVVFEDCQCWNKAVTLVLDSTLGTTLGMAGNNQPFSIRKSRESPLLLLFFFRPSGLLLTCYFHSRVVQLNNRAFRDILGGFDPGFNIWNWKTSTTIT